MCLHTSSPGTLYLLAFSPSLEPLSFTADLNLSTPCSQSDPTLSHQDAALAHVDSLPPLDLVIRIEGFVLFSFGKRGSGILAKCSLCEAEANHSYSKEPALSAKVCIILQGLGSTKTATSLPFLLHLNCCFILSMLSSRWSFLLSHTL